MVCRLLDPVRACEAKVAVDLPDQDEYDLRVYDTQRHRRLVAAVEITSPANEDRPEHRRALVVCLEAPLSPVGSFYFAFKSSTNSLAVLAPQLLRWPSVSVPVSRY